MHIIMCITFLHLTNMHTLFRCLGLIGKYFKRLKLNINSELYPVFNYSAHQVYVIIMALKIIII